MITMSCQAAGHWVDLPGRLDTNPFERLGEQPMARKFRIGRRRPDRVDIREAFWADRYAQAHSPQAVAATEYDRLRVETSKLPPREQDRVWRDLAAHMARVREQVEQVGERATQRDVHA